MTKYAIIDRKTGEQVGKPYTSKNRARGRVDKLDNEYGGFVTLLKKSK